ncbi:hypothetical protein VTO42DRAFT_6990 [Malbranchea cinnamomea]
MGTNSDVVVCSSGVDEGLESLCSDHQFLPIRSNSRRCLRERDLLVVRRRDDFLHFEMTCLGLLGDGQSCWTL